MKYTYTLFLLLSGLAIACGPAEEQSEVDGLKEQLKERQAYLKEVAREIKDLEEQIVSIDPDFNAYQRNARLITTRSAETGTFEHFVQVRGNVASNTNVTLAAESSGTVSSVKVREGQYVQKGATLIVLGANILRNSIAEIKKSLELAETLYEKQKTLWEDNIGTEVQFLQAKNRVESLKARLATTQAQLSLSITTAPFSGRIDKVFVNGGEQIFPGAPLLRMVGEADMYLEADLSESYIGSFKRGDEVIVSFPSLDKETSTNIDAVGEVINPLNRTITVEIDLPKVEGLKPNMLAIVRLKDFGADDAVMVPTNLIQTDRNGDFVFVLGTDENSQPVAKKVRVKRGRNYQGMTMVLEGLSGDEMLVDEGFREVVDGAFVKVAPQAG